MAVGSFKLPISSEGEWVRPSDWLPMPTGITSANQTFVGLYAVFSQGQNYAAFIFTTSAGQYRVDWGDGTITLHNSGTLAQYEYNYATISNSTLTSRGYKQSMITVTAVSGNLLTCNFQQRFVTSPVQNQAYSTGFLDCIISMPNANTGLSIAFGGVTVKHAYVERVNILTIGNVTSLGTASLGLFQECYSLENINLFNTVNVNVIQNMFSNCLNLKKIPLYNFQNVGGATTTFNNCVSLKELPLFNFQNVTNANQIFSGCRGIKEFPLFNFQNVTNASGIFNSCNSIKTLPLFNFQNVTTLVAAFQACSNLKELPLFNTANVTTFQNAFSSTSLEKIPNFSTASVLLSSTAFEDYRNNNSLKKVEFIIKTSVNFSNCQLSRTALVEIFNNLASRTLTTAANINITGNWGASALTAADRLIATSKNWTITG